MPTSTGRKPDYYEYIQSDEWRRKAQEAKHRAGNRCQICNRPAGEVLLNAHHRTYERLGNELPGDITVLCRDCHKLYEDNKKLSKPHSVPAPVPFRAPLPTAHQPTVKAPLPVNAANVSRVQPQTPTSANAGISWRGAGALGLLAVVLWFVLIHTNSSTRIPKPTVTPTNLAIAEPPTLTPSPTLTPTLPSLSTISETQVLGEIVIVSGNRGFIRSGPGGDYSVLRQASQGTKLRVVAYNDDKGVAWYQLVSGGWIPSIMVDKSPINLPYVSLTTENEQVKPPTPTPTPTSSSTPLPPTPSMSTVNKDASIRSGPGVNYSKVRVAPKGSSITIVGYNDDTGYTWYQLADGGWIFHDLVDGPPQRLRYASAPSSPTRPVQPPTPTPAPLQPRVAAEEPVQASPNCAGGCTDYPTWCAPPIKGNVSQNTGEKIYHLPGQEYYDDTNISPAYGERWFCTEDEAIAAGWRRSKQ